VTQKKPKLTAAERRRERWARNGRFRFDLSFAAVDCQCGGVRLRTAECPDCGATPEGHDFDAGLQRRQRLSKRAIDALKPKTTDTRTYEDITVPESFDKLAEATGPFLRALQQFTVSKTDAGDDVVAACNEVAALRNQLAQAPTLRPWLFARNEAARVAAGLTRTLSSFVLATSAPTPELAKALNAQAQRELDELGEIGGRVGDLFERWNTVSGGGSIAEFLEATATDVYVTMGAGTLEDLDAAASVELANVLGRQPGPDQGLVFMLHDLWVTVLGDREKFREAITNFDRLVERHSTKFNSLLSRPAVISGLQEGALQLADQVQQTMVTIERATSDRQQVRAVIQLMHAMFEGPGRRFAGAALELVGKGTFENLLDEDGARVVELTQQDRNTRRSFYGFEKSFRVAYAHQNYTRTSTGITVSRRGKPDDAWTDDEILDSLIAAMECTVALALTLSLRAQDRGVALEPPAALEALGLDDTSMLTMALSLVGCTDIRVEASDEPTVQFTADRLTTIMRVLISRTFPDALRARVEVTSTAGALDVWDLDLAGFRQMAAANDEVTEQAHLVTALWHSMKNEQPVLPKEVLVHWAAGRTTALLQVEAPDATTALRELTQLVKFARAIEEPDLEEAIRKVKAFFRLALVGDLNDAARSGAQDINRFILDNPPELDELS